MLLYVMTELTSMSRGRRVILCMGRMRKEIMGRFLQSGWPSILVSTSLKAGFLDLQEEKREGAWVIGERSNLMIHRKKEGKK